MEKSQSLHDGNPPVVSLNKGAIIRGVDIWLIASLKEVLNKPSSFRLFETRLLLCCVPAMVLSAIEILSHDSVSS